MVHTCNHSSWEAWVTQQEPMKEEEEKKKEKRLGVVLHTCNLRGLCGEMLSLQKTVGDGGSTVGSRKWK